MLEERGEGIRRGKKIKEALLKKYRESKESKSNFCRKNNLALSTFHGWLNSERKRVDSKNKEGIKSKFIELPIMSGEKEDRINEECLIREVNLRICVGSFLVFEYHQGTRGGCR